MSTINQISVSLDYKALGADIFDDIKSDLEKNYITTVRATPGTAAMGIWDTVVTVYLNTTLEEFAIQNVAWDIVKIGAKSLVLAPLMKALRNLESKNPDFDYMKAAFYFQDTVLVFYGLEKLFTSKIGLVFPKLCNHYSSLSNLEGKKPDIIFIPIRYDDEQSSFVDYGEGDDFEQNEYLKYWGIYYDPFGYERNVFDVEEGQLLNKPFK